MPRILIAGGGLAGAAAACELARAGRRVTVLERNTGPTDKICGEFLSAAAQHYLTRLGVDFLALGGQVITRVRIVRGAQMAEADLPFAGLGLSRRLLDEALLRRAVGCGAEVLRETVTELSPDIRFLATGKHDLPGVRRPVDGRSADLVGFKTYFRLSPSEQAAVSGTVEVILLNDGYAGLLLVEDGRANLCLLINRDRLARVGGTWPALLDDLRSESAHLRRRLLDAEALMARPLAIARVPYGFIHTPGTAETMFRLGDQACVISSFSGAGMSIALHSAAIAVQCHLNGAPPAHYYHRLRNDVAGSIHRAGKLYRIGSWVPGQPWLFHALQLWPGLIRRAAAATRVRKSAWLHDQRR